MANFIYNVGEIIMREDECFWIFPRAYMKDTKYYICSPWFSCLREKWRLVKKPYYTTGSGGYWCDEYENYVQDKNSHFDFLLWTKTRSSLLKHKYTILLKLAMENGTELLERTEVTDSDYGSQFGFRERIHNEIFSKNELIKLVFDIQTEEHSSTNTEIRDGVIHTGDKENRQNDQIIEDKESSEDEGSSEDEMNGENEENIKKKSNLSKIKGVKMLAQNLKQVFLDEQVTDTVLKIDSREFKVHKVILVARSPVFASMFQHDLAEKNSNSVDIPDCTAESFEVFLYYLYTGSADTISPSNVYNLYYAADKYHVNDLKEKCVKFMKNNLSAETFCDIIALSLRHGEKKLQKAATSFFCANIKSILRTVQWQKYMAENPTQANELLIKAHGA